MHTDREYTGSTHRTGRPGGAETEELTARLYDSCLDAVHCAAGLGWTPADVVHVCGPDAAPLCRRVAEELSGATTGAVSPALAAQWVRETQVAGPPPWDLERLARLRLALAETRCALGGATLFDAPARPADGRDKVAEKISGLLRKAASTNFAAEAEALSAKAHELRRRRLIDRCAHRRPDPKATVEKRVHLRAPWVRHQFLLLSEIARANTARAVLVHDRGIAAVFGTAADIAATTGLFAVLNVQRDRFMRRGPQARAAAARGATAPYRRAFQVGYARRIGRRLAAAADRARARAEAAAVDAAAATPVLLGRRLRAAQAAARVYPATSGMRFSAAHHSGWQAGWEAGGRSRLTGEPVELDADPRPDGRAA